MPESQTESPGAALAPPQPRPRKVLVVEDEVLIRLMIADALRNRGFVVLEAINADEAVTLLQSQAPVHLLFTDVQMPGSMDGLTLVHLARKAHPELKVILGSGHLRGGYSQQAADAFFPKPYNLDVVVECVERLLAGL